MIQSPSKDLFDDKTMSFGEHLEELRTHLIKALIGLAVGVMIALLYADRLVTWMQAPVQNALRQYHERLQDKRKNAADLNSFSTWLPWASSEKPKVAPATVVTERPAPLKTHKIQLDATALLHDLHKVQPQIPAPPETQGPHWIEVNVNSRDIQGSPESLSLLKGDTIEGPFMVYLRVALVAGLMISSPWVFYQLWMFVAAGLYQHEKKYVYYYMPISLGLFFGGAAFCFFAVIPNVIAFLLTFYENMQLDPLIQISQWMTFAVMLPVLFGVSFQLPVVMLLLERISIFEVKDYREKRRMAILAIAFISMVLTPADPVSMCLMMFPLLFLYEVGIWMCQWHVQPASPFPDAVT